MSNLTKAIAVVLASTPMNHPIRVLRDLGSFGYFLHFGFTLTKSSRKGLSISKFLLYSAARPPVLLLRHSHFCLGSVAMREKKKLSSFCLYKRD